MFTEDELLDMAIEICDEYGMPRPSEVRYNSRTSKTFGICWPHGGVIELSYKFCIMNRNEVVIALLKHECAHMRYGGHGDDFAALCHEMGITVHVQDMFDDVNVPAKYISQCPICKSKFHQFKGPYKPGSCSYCDPDGYNEEFDLILIKGDE